LALGIFKPDLSEELTGKTVNVGTQIVLYATLYKSMNGAWGGIERGKPVSFYHRLNTGTWEKIGTVNTGTCATRPEACGSGNASVLYTLAGAGTHSFYAEFAGDDVYEGCPTTAATVSAQGGAPPPAVPEWLIGLGIVAGACVLTLAVTKALKWW
jgi:hypothetical protein